MASAAVAVVGHNNPPPLREVLAENYASLVREIEAVATKANDAPKEIKNDADVGVLGDVVKEARAVSKRLETVRTTEKEPHLSAGREIDAFFKGHGERLDRVVKVLEGRASDYQRAKAAEERRRREEEARKAREEEERRREAARKAEEEGRQRHAVQHEDKAEAAAERAAEAEALAQASAADLTRVRTEGGTVVSSRTSWEFEITDYNAVSLETLRPYLARADIEKAIRTFVRVNKNSIPLTGVRIFEDVKASFR